MTTKQSSPITPQLITNVILPAAVLVGAAGYFHPPWLPYAVALAVGIGGLHFIVPASADAIADQPVSKQKTADATLSNAAPAIEVVEEEKERLPLDPEVFQEYPLIEKTVLSHNTAIYRFKLLKEDATLGLPIGQHISLAATLDVKDQKTGEVVRKEVIRSYTPVSSENEPGYFDLLIKSYPQGNLSRHFAELKIGDTMKVKGPKGAMVYTPNMNKHIGMIAGGSGITPMLQVARAIVRGRGNGDTTRVDLIFANVDEKDILLREDLDKLAREDDKFNVYYVLNNPPAGWTGGSGFVTPEMIKEHFPAPSKDNKVLICGPPPMVSAMKKATESLGFEKARIVSKLPDQVFCF